MSVRLILLPRGALPETVASTSWTAAIDEEHCLAYRGAPCRVCFEVCPVEGVIELARGEHAYVPVAGAQACVGCGVCLQHCPVADAIVTIPQTMV